MSNQESISKEGFQSIVLRAIHSIKPRQKKRQLTILPRYLFSLAATFPFRAILAKVVSSVLSSPSPPPGSIAAPPVQLSLARNHFSSNAILSSSYIKVLISLKTRFCTVWLVATDPPGTDQLAAPRAAHKPPNKPPEHYDEYYYPRSPLANSSFKRICILQVDGEAHVEARLEPG